jgi:hypothetical protein
MSELNYNYRQNIIKNAEVLQKHNTINAVKYCCLCDQCSHNKIIFMNNYYTNNTFTTEPSDLQQNYNAYFENQKQKARLNILTNSYM